MEALDDTFLIRLGRAEDEIAHAVDLDPSALPQQRIRELDVEFADVHRRRWFSERGEGCGAHVVFGEGEVAR